MRYQHKYVRPIHFKRTAYNMARLFYASFSDLSFEDDLVEYLKHGFVHSTPTCFALVKVINIAEEKSGLVEPAWFVRFACGDVAELVRALPGYFPFIVWCRNNEGGGTVFRIYRTERLLKLVYRKNRKVVVTSWPAD